VWNECDRSETVQLRNRTPDLQARHSEGERGLRLAPPKSNWLQKPVNATKAACELARPRNETQDCGFATCIALCDEFRWSSWSPRQCCGPVGSRVVRTRSRRLPPHLKHAELCAEFESGSCLVHGVCDDELQGTFSLAVSPTRPVPHSAVLKTKRLLYNVVYACILGALLAVSLLVLWLLCTTRRRVAERFQRRALTRAAKRSSVPTTDAGGQSRGVSANLPMFVADRLRLASCALSNNCFRKASKSDTTSSSSLGLDKKKTKQGKKT